MLVKLETTRLYWPSHLIIMLIAPSLRATSLKEFLKNNHILSSDADYDVHLKSLCTYCPSQANLPSKWWSGNLWDYDWEL